MRDRSRTGLVLMILLSAVALPSRAGQLEKLLMPGELAAAHAELESDCGTCHDRTDKGRQRALCLDCHEEIAADVSARRGFHGRSAVAGQCSACHTEHQGRGADIVGLAPEGFDHARTDFQLAGAHAAVACARCHVPQARFREAPRQCVECHREDDVHAGMLGTDCATCHDAGRFGAARFDHSRTRFPLRDAHAGAPCSACHEDDTFKGAPTRCAGCHAADDVHRGSRGQECASCHVTADWKQTRFDHEKASGYALLGRHKALECDSCHRGGDLKSALPRECGGCHAAADPHAGRMGGACGDCHGQDRWEKAGFDHERRAKFALRGAHAELACHACHTGIVGQQALETQCAGCHGVDDVHRGSMGRDCAACHRETGWRDAVKFDHDLARFPLVGLHVAAACEDCHATRAFHDAPDRCVDCHRDEDVHRGALGEECHDCHNPNGWNFWQFDHAASTDFALTGAHGKLGCRDCHRKPAHEAAISGDCAACHRADDAHDGRFGTDCARCHDTRSFRDPKH
jgi:hypothetical protein